MKRSRSKLVVTEINCPACDGTGFPLVPQPQQAGRKIYPAPCPQCLGKGRISSLGESTATDCAASNSGARFTKAEAEGTAVAGREFDVAPLFTSNNSSNS